jgi:hypothetical protein
MKLVKQHHALITLHSPEIEINEEEVLLVEDAGQHIVTVILLKYCQCQLVDLTGLFVIAG